MNKISEIPNRMGITVDYGDFLIIRPKTNYRINSGLIIIKGDEPVIIDTGTPRDPGMKRIRQAFNDFKIDPLSVKYIIITHSHQDHNINLRNLEGFCKNAKVICHKRDLYNIQHSASLPKSWGLALKILGKDKFVRNTFSVFMVPIVMMFYKTPNFYPRIDYTYDTKLNKNLDLNNFEYIKRIKSGNLEFKLIPSSGHTAGHTCILDSNKNLYLGDFCPFTPWVNPLAEALDDMINSIKGFIKLSDNDVKFAIRSHGDIRRGNPLKDKKVILNDKGPWYDKNNTTWEVAPWDQERARFQYWLEVINNSLERIPKILRKKPLSILDITNILIPQYAKYSFFMKLVFIPPSVTWIIAYCLKLEKLGKIKRIYKGKHLLWSI